MGRKLTPEREALRRDAIRIRQELGWSEWEIANHLSLPQPTIHLWLTKNSVAVPINNSPPLALNTVHVMDVLEGLRRLPPNSVDLVFADPPYNIGVNYGNGYGDSDKRPSQRYFEWCSLWFEAIRRILKDTGSFYVMHYPEVCARWLPLLDSWFTFRRWITWHYPTNIGHSPQLWTRSQRAILFYTKSSRYTFNADADPQPYRNPTDRRIREHLKRGRDGVTPYDFWEYNLVKNVSKEKTRWPNQVPLALVERIVRVSSNLSDLVCDPFIGSGTTAVAAAKHGRRWIGFDLAPESPTETTGRLKKLQSEREV